MINKQVLDGNKLLQWMYENGYFSLKSADMIADEMEKGTFDLAESEGEAFNALVEARHALRQIIGDMTPAQFVVEVVQNQEEFRRTLNDNERLRAALEYVHGELIGGNIFTENSLKRSIHAIEQALSTTTEPTGASWQHVKPGEFVEYSDFQFGNLSGARLDHIEIHAFGIYAVLIQGDHSYTVPYEKIKRREDSTND